MLTKRFLYGLTLVTIVVCTAASLVQYNRWADTIRNVDEELVFPELSDRLETITKIKIERSSSDTRGSFVIEPFETSGVSEKKVGIRRGTV